MAYAQSNHGTIIPKAFKVIKKASVNGISQGKNKAMAELKKATQLPKARSAKHGKGK